MNGDESPKVLKWFEVTWVTASGRTLVKAEDEGEAKMLASQNAEAAAKVGPRAFALAEGKSVIHQWFIVNEDEPLIFDVEELAEDTAAELKREMEGG